MTTRVLFSIGIIQIAVVLVNLVRAKVLSLMLGPGGFGIFSTVDQVVVTVVNLASLSLSFTAMKFMARAHSDGHEQFRRAFAAFLRALSTLALMAVVVTTIILVWRPGVFGGDLVPYRSLMHVAILSVPFVMLNILFVNALASAQQATASAILILAVAIALAIAAIIGAAIAGLQGLFTATVIGGGLTTFGTLLYLRKRLGVGATAEPVSLRQELRRSPEIVSYSMYLYAAMSAYTLTMMATRYFVFSRLGEVDAGYYQALMSIALTVGAALAPMNNLYLTPLVNRVMPADQKVAIANDFARKMTLLLLLASLPVVLFPRLVLTVLYAPAFAAAAGALSVFVIWQCLYQVVNVYQQLLIGLDDVRFFVVTMVVAYAAATLLFPVLIPLMGLGGAPLSLAAGMLISGCVVALRLRSRFALAVAPGVIIRLGLCLGAIGSIALGFSTTTEWTISGITLRAVVSLAALPVLWCLVTPAERARLRQQVRRFRV